MASIKDDRGYNQGFSLVKSTEVRMRRRADLILSEMQSAEGKSVLEIGCGTGEVAFWMAEKTVANVLGTDLCVPFVDKAKEKFQLANLRYAVLDFNKVDQFKGEKFDYIVGNGILHHLYHHLDEALSNMKNLLREGGKLIFLEPNYHNPYVYLVFTHPKFRKMANLEPDEMAFSKSFIKKKLKSVGYHNIEVDYKDFLLPGIPNFLIKPSIVAGNIIEKIPIAKSVSQSIFIRAVSG